MELMVKGMTCEGCVRAVTRALKAQDSTAIVTVDLPSGKVTIDGALSEDQASAAIENAGFTLTG